MGKNCSTVIRKMVMYACEMISRNWFISFPIIDLFFNSFLHFIGWDVTDASTDKIASLTFRHIQNQGN